MTDLLPLFIGFAIGATFTSVMWLLARRYWS